MRLKPTLLALAATLLLSLSLSAQQRTTVRLQTSDKDGALIPKEIYGQFSEHLGSCIYGGLWVGPDSPIPNRDGYRLDVFNALKELKVPVMRWPGGCFADDYHWRDGIGPLEKRARISNNHWGGTLEDNSFGTHEFLNLCEMLGCEPYISGNVGSGSVAEMSQWIEYMTSDSGSTVAEERRANGREKPWKVKYFGVGNECWGCGGNMRPEYYVDEYRRFATYCRNYGGNRLYKVASGASDYDYNWTEVLMKGIGNRMHGLSLHYYTVVGSWNEKGSATGFSDERYYQTLAKAIDIENVLQKHIAIMDRYDPQGRVDLLVDEWGTWWDVEPGTNPGHLFQQNTMRDAMVAAYTLNIFHRYTRRVKMANIAQVVNVLQSMILTRGDQMVLTPTYHVFRMYNVHQDAQYVPVNYTTDRMAVDERASVPTLSVTASRKDGVLHVSLANADLTVDNAILLTWDEIGAGGLSRAAQKALAVSGEILTSASVGDFNDFGVAPKVAPMPMKNLRVTAAGVEFTLPAHSIATIEIR